MGCACINKIFDLSVSAMGSTQMVIEDQSVWMDDAGFSDALSIEVSVKSLTRRGMVYKTVPLAVNRRNILTAEDLGIGKPGDCIKDDLYCFSVVSCGVGMSITRAYLANAYCALDALVANAKDEKDERIIRRIELLIGAIESATILDRAEEAKGNYKILTELLKDLICDCC